MTTKTKIDRTLNTVRVPFHGHDITVDVLTGPGNAVNFWMRPGDGSMGVPMARLYDGEEDGMAYCYVTNVDEFHRYDELRIYEDASYATMAL